MTRASTSEDANQLRRKGRTPDEVFALLRAFESRNITFVEADGSWPIVWDRASGVHVWDQAGRRYLDLTAAFGVASAGHANPRVIAAGRRQMGKLLHAMSDVHPHVLKGELARVLSHLTFERWSSADVERPRQAPHTGKAIFCNAGFEAVEAALKTALLATGRPGVIAFDGAYHGLGYGALNVTRRDHFRGHFRSQLAEFGHFVPFPTAVEELDVVAVAIRQVFREKEIGAILVEPVQVRGGVNVPTGQFLPMLRRLCDEFQALLIVDEIYTGFGRTGRWFACEHVGVVPDVICLGKALTGGFPLSVCVGRADVMDAAWPPAMGDPIHTSTFLGHPVGCAMALAQLEEISKRQLVQRSAELGGPFLAALSALRARPSLSVSARGVGLLAGVELRSVDGSPAASATFDAVKAMLARGFVVLPDGDHGNVISFAPPLTITTRQLTRAVAALAEVLGGV